jgi:7-carboxy-7-deazaguanine synthase
VKCPGSGEGGSFRLPNLDTLTLRDEMKFVIANRADYEFARQFIRQHSLDRRVGQILLSPAFTKTPTAERSAENLLLDPRSVVEWMLEDGLNARLNLQIHKFIWEPATKGV